MSDCPMLISNKLHSFRNLDVANLHKISGISAELQQINATGFDN